MVKVLLVDDSMVISSLMMEEQFTTLDETVKSCIAELGNVITGRAGRSFEKTKTRIKLSPPILIFGSGVEIVNINIKRINLPIITDAGEINISISIMEDSK